MCHHAHACIYDRVRRFNAWCRARRLPIMVGAVDVSRWRQGECQANARRPCRVDQEALGVGVAHTCRCKPLTGVGSGSGAASPALSGGISMLRPCAPPEPGCASDCRLPAAGRSGDCIEHELELRVYSSLLWCSCHRGRQWLACFTTHSTAALAQHLALPVGAAAAPEVAPHRPCDTGPP